MDPEILCILIWTRNRLAHFNSMTNAALQEATLVLVDDKDKKTTAFTWQIEAWKTTKLSLRLQRKLPLAHFALLHNQVTL